MRTKIHTLIEYVPEVGDQVYWDLRSSDWKPVCTIKSIDENDYAHVEFQGLGGSWGKDSLVQSMPCKWLYWDRWRQQWFYKDSPDGWGNGYAPPRNVTQYPARSKGKATPVPLEKI